jgi:quercetin dioxygenase-like cupin family protein
MNMSHLSVFSLIFLIGYAQAQEVTMTTPSVSRTDLLTALLVPGKTISKIEIKEVTLGPNVKAPLHLHPCPVVGIVSKGEIAFQIEGKPVQHLKVGDAFYEPANVRVARFDNEGNSTATFSAFYLLGDKELELIRMLPE